MVSAVHLKILPQNKGFLFGSDDSAFYYFLTGIFNAVYPLLVRDADQFFLLRLLVLYMRNPLRRQDPAGLSDRYKSFHGLSLCQPVLLLIQASDAVFLYLSYHNQLLHSIPNISIIKGINWI